MIEAVCMKCGASASLSKRSTAFGRGANAACVDGPAAIKSLDRLCKCKWMIGAIARALSAAETK